MDSLQLLGPLLCLRGGVAATIGTAKAAAILAWLALDGPAPRGRIAAALWPALDEASARRNLRRELARLRDAGLAAWWVSEGERLRLAATVAIDVDAFAAELAAGRPEAALALWRGPVADGLSVPDAPAFEDALASARSRLARERTAALEACARAHEARGDSAAALRAIDVLLADDPLQEAHQRTAMRLHAAAGRRAAAIAGYERFAALLAAELGLAPMADTVALVRTLRQADAPPVTPAPRAPRPSPPEVAAAAPSWPAPARLPFVGRGAELQRLAEAWEQGRALVIEGPGGIGKTRLATEFAAQCGAFALAACRPGDAVQPYAAFTRALRRLAGQPLAADGVVSGWPRWVAAELALVLPELGLAPQRIDSEAARQRFFEACAEAWSLLAAADFDAVIVDDWHLADAPSRALLDFIVRRRVAAKGGPGEIILTRPGLPPNERAAIDKLVGDGMALHTVLAPLAPQAVSELASEVSGVQSLPAELSARLLRASGGVPLAIGETLRHWAALSLWGPGTASGSSPGTGSGVDTGDTLPDPVKSGVLARVAALPDAARRVIEAAALADEPFTAALLAGACALSEVQALDAIDSALAAHLLHERASSPAGGGGFAFTHDLVQAAIESAIAPERKRLVHRRLALGAEALRGTSAVAPAAIARHWELGGEPRRAVEPRLAAAEAALALYAVETAEQHWALALANGATLAQQISITTRRGSMARNRDDRAAMVAAVAELDRLAEACLQQPHTAASAHDATIEATNLLTLMRIGEPLQRIEAVRAALPPPQPGDSQAVVERRAMAALIHSQALNGAGRADEGAAVAEAALAAAELSPNLQGRLLHSLVFACFQQSRTEQALAAAQRSLVLWRSAGNRRSIARAYSNLGLILGQLGRYEEARRDFGHAVELATEMRIPELARDVQMNLAYIDLHDGLAAAALDRLALVWGEAGELGRLTAAVYVRGMQVQAQVFLGQLGTAFDLAEDNHRRIVGLNTGDAVTDCVSMTLDLATDCGDFALADHWRACLPEEALMPRYYRIKLAFNLVHLALVRGRLDEAEAELAALGDITALPQPDDRSYAALRHAELCLARGDAAGALEWLVRGQPDSTHVEVCTLAWAARVRALQALHGAADTRTRQAVGEARAWLAATPGAPALAALRLCQACGFEHQALLQQLAASLDARPQLRASFLARWAAAEPKGALQR